MTGHFIPAYVALSVLVAICVSHTALSLAARIAAPGHRSRRLWLGGGAVTMGCGIWAMHFIGMLAFELPIALSYDPVRTAASLLIAVATSGLALWIASSQVRHFRISVGAVFMGLGISAMHYTGMSAIRVRPAITYDSGLVLLSVAVAVAASFVALWLFFHLRVGSARGLRIARLGAAIIMGTAISGMHYIGMATSHFAPGADAMGTPAAASAWLAITVTTVSFALLTTMSLLLNNDASLEHAATHDALTGLPNRVLLMDRLARALARAGREQTQFAVLLLDLDRFKSINESLGHRAGDDLLRTVAARVSALLRQSDTLARLGGDEFVVLLDRIASPSDAEQVAAKIIEQVALPMMISGIELCITVSIGISVAPADGAAGDALLQHTDAAMYEAKKAGRNLYRFFSGEMEAVAREHLELENALRRALARREFELHYQPKIDTNTQQVRGAEALLRWRHPTRGLVSPADFIPLAEETGLIIPIGEWVIEEACRQARIWHMSGAPGLRIAVNLSAQQFRQNNLVNVVERALERAGLEARFLELELTESSIMNDAERAIRVLQQLTHLGVRVSVDDFGTGYSSLSYLRRLPLDRLKIDRSFIRDVATNREDGEIVRAIIALAHTLQLQVVAEGVETREQLEYLRSLGCDQYQGYYYSPPLRADAFRELMHQRRARDPDATVISLDDTRRELNRRH